MRTVTALKLGVLGLAAAGAGAAAYFGVERFEAHHLALGQAAIEESGQNWAELDIDGLTLRITGEAESEKARFRAMTALQTALPRFEVKDEITVAEQLAAPMPEFRVEILRSGQDVTLHGLLPGTTKAAAALPALIQELNPELNVSDILAHRDSPAPENWSDALELGLKAILALPQSRVEITGDAVLVSGLLLDQSEQALAAELEAAAPDSLALTINLQIPRQVRSPYTTTILGAETGLALEGCLAPDAESLEALQNLAQELGAAQPDCEEALGAPDSDWTVALRAGMQALADRPGARLILSDLTASFIPGDALSPEARNETQDALRRDLPAAYRLRMILPSIEASGAVAEFLARKSETGAVDLSGPLPSAEADATLATLAAARFGEAELTRANALGTGLPQDWMMRVFAALETLDSLESGEISVRPDMVSVTGIYPFDMTEADISARLATALGPETVITLDLTAAPEPVEEEEETGPDPQTCLTQLNEVQLAGKITFEPGSTQIGGDGLTRINEIAAIMRDCSTVTFEIGGHTDSQGREEMNLALSQSRANSVMDALVARRVPPSQLTAKGYGETQPIADNGSEAGREANRRIAFRLSLPAELDPEAQEDSQNDG
ncbi:MAG: OmpA family protein [Mangrovicoccus sp.]